METLNIVITVLVGLLGMAAGVGIAHLTIMKKLNVALVNQARTDEQIVTLFRNHTEMKADSTNGMALVREVLTTVQTLVQQNTILIERNT